MSKVIILCHVEDIFEMFMDDEFLEELARSADKYDWINHLNSEIGEPNPIVNEIANQHIHFSWGYEKGIDYDPIEDGCWVIGSYGHEWTWIPPEFRNHNDWKHHHIKVGGGWDGECLEDFRCVLRHVGIEFQNDPCVIY